MNFFKKIWRKSRTFSRIPGSKKFLFAEAFFTSLMVKTTLVFLPFRIVVKWLGSSQSELLAPKPESNTEIITGIRLIIKMCDKNVPWKTECYTNALTAKIMLKRRKLVSTLYFGFYKDNSGKLIGHAWLQSSGIIVSGFCNFSKFQVHSVFS